MILSRCKLCGSSAIYPRYKMAKCLLEILRCRDCGFLFVDYINTNYLIPVDTDWDFEGHAPKLADKFNIYCRHISAYFDFHDKTILDVGAGGGDFLYQTKLRGAKPVGVDLDLTGIKFAKATYDIDILPSLVEEAVIAEHSLDAVTMWEVIEHVNDPVKTIASISKLLKKDGWLFLSTPSLDSLWDRAAFMLYAISFGLIQFPLTYRFSWAHLQIFSKKHMFEILGKNGFEIQFYEQRTEFTYPTEIYLKKIRSRFLRKFIAGTWEVMIKIIPIGNKMIVYARKSSLSF